MGKFIVSVGNDCRPANKDDCKNIEDSLENLSEDRENLSEDRLLICHHAVVCQPMLYNGESLIIQVGNDARPAEKEDIEQIAKDLKEFYKNNKRFFVTEFPIEIFDIS